MMPVVVVSPMAVATVVPSLVNVVPSLADVAEVSSLIAPVPPDPSLKNLLHVPSICKNLLSVSKFAHDNSIFFEFHSSFFCYQGLPTQVHPPPRSS
jgi:hypothetical protein